MADSPEHKYITQSLDRALHAYADTRLLGLAEADRRRFDYGCMLVRDASRPLVSQVLWSHEHGIEKDIRTLLFEAEASLKLYFVRDRIKNRAKIDDVLKDFRENASTRPMLRGLRIVPVPEGFDADSLEDQAWMDRYVRGAVASDLLFAVVFGKLAPRDVRVFSNHGGPVGLKIAALHVIDTKGYSHGPTFEREVGAKGSPLREAIAMLTGVGLIVSPRKSAERFVTLKGRFLLDLARLLTFERRRLAAWSDETGLILSHLELETGDGWEELGPGEIAPGPVSDILLHADYARRQFGVDIMEGVSTDAPRFYSRFSVAENIRSGSPGVSAALWSDDDDVARFD